LVAGDQKVPCQAQYDDFGASAIFPKLVTTQLFHVPVTEKCSERLMISGHKVTEKATRLTVVLKNCFQECFQEL
jgi:hypothetical protein